MSCHRPPQLRRILKRIGAAACVLLFVPYIASPAYANIFLQLHITIATLTAWLWILDNRPGTQWRAKRVGLIASAVLMTTWLVSAPCYLQYAGTYRSLGIGHGCLEYVTVRSDNATAAQLKQGLSHPALHRAGPAPQGWSFRYYPITSYVSARNIIAVWFGLGLTAPRVYRDKDFWSEYTDTSRSKVVWFDRGGFLIPLWIVLAIVAAPTAVLCYRDFRSIPPGHCQACGYNLTGNESGVCPECATSVPKQETTA